MPKRAYGNGALDQRGENSWRLRYRIDGKVFTKTIKGTKKDATVELRRLLTSGDSGQHIAPAKKTLGQWIDEWISIGAPGRKRRKVGARAIERYEELLRIHVVPVLGQRPLQSLRSTEIDNLYVGIEGRISPRTARHVHSVFGASLATALRTRQVSVNPMDFVTSVPSPGESDHGTALEDHDLRKLVEGFRESGLFAFVAVLAFTGMRRNEALALRWSDLNLEDKKLRIERALEETKLHGSRFKGPKNDRHKRTIEIDDGLLTLLAAERAKYLRLAAGIGDGATVDLSLLRLPEDALMFPSAGTFTTPRDARSVTKGFKRQAAKLGFHLRLHDLRGSHETALLDKGVPVHVVADRCGHDPAVLLRTYAKRRKNADSAAADVIGAMTKGLIG